MINILIGAVTILVLAVTYLLVHLTYIKREFAEIEEEQIVQNERIIELMEMQEKQSMIINFLLEKDELLGKNKFIYPTIIGEA